MENLLTVFREINKGGVSYQGCAGLDKLKSGTLVQFLTVRREI